MGFNGKRIVIVGFLMTLACAASARAQLDISWYTIDGGGGTSTGGGYSISGTIGQPDAGVVLTGGMFEINGGFWPTANVCFCPGDLNGDGQKDGRDIQQFLSCVLSGDNCSCADVDQANGVTLADVPVFVNALMSGGTCS